jgi:tetratricopeptide (TPR) repeat protein
MNASGESGPDESPAILPEEQWLLLEEAFECASELDPARREAYLDGRVDLPGGVRQRLEELLAALPDATDDGTRDETGLGRSVGRIAAQTFAEFSLQEGKRIGAYRLLDVIGRGGMGVVYRAVRDDDEYHKQVAIKVAAWMSEELHQRFLHERQILATFEHPNIARLMDGGTTEDGSPYVVMEFVAGEPIDEWIAKRKPSRRKILELLIAVCRTVDYAHRHLVVHRDLKPGNILVTAEEAPKLLDFGIAKALDPGVLGAGGALTVDATRLMTPNFASPEQVRGKAITTSTDVYQLGVLAYQLLTGRRLFNVTTERLGELERFICETPPPKPNLAEDLDRILLHALEKEPSRRYATAGEMADDLERYLSGLPVMARGAAWNYYARKFVLRHKIGAGTALAGVLLLLGFSAAMAVQARRLRQERDTAEQVSTLLQSVFSANDPNQARGSKMTAGDLLNRGTATIESEQGLDPHVKERLLQTLVAAYRSQGMYDRARTLNNELLELDKQLYGSRSPQVIDTLAVRTNLDAAEERYDLQEKDSREWIDLVDSLHEGPSQRLEATLDMLATNEFVHSDMAHAQADAEREVQVTTQLHGADSPQVYAHLLLLGNILWYRGDFAAEEKVYRRAYDFFQSRNAENTPEIGQLMSFGTRLGYALGREGKYAEAETLLRRMLALREKVNGRESDATSPVQAYLGFVLGREGKRVEAESLLKQAVETQKARIGAGMNYAAFEQLLAEIYENEGRYAEAEPLLRDRVAICITNLGQKSLALARTLTALGRVQTERGELVEARKTLESAVEMEREENGDGTVYAAANLLALGKLSRAEKNLPAAEEALRQSLFIYRQTSNRPGMAEALNALASLIRLEGRDTESDQLAVEAAGLRRAMLAGISQ